LVEEALQSLPQPFSEHVIDEVFFAIESTPRWRKEYEGLCLKHTKTVVNNLGGYWIGRALGKVGKKQVPSKKSTLIGSYSILDTDAQPRVGKPKEQDALDAMSKYYRENQATLPPLAVMKKHRDEIVELLMDGVPAQDAFAMVLSGDA
jgi:hypothetical protein